VNLSQFKSILRQAFLLPVVALLVTAAALYVQIRGANATVDLIQESDARISQATLVAKLMADEESGLRGYETTTDTRFLQPFVDAESHMPTELSRLENVAGADAEQKHYVANLENEYQTWRDAFALQIIATVKAGGLANDLDLNLTGKAEMDRIRQDLDNIIHNAEAHRTVRIARWHRQVHSMLVALLVLALGMGVLIGLFTRSRLHAVSVAYSSSLDVLGRRAEELFQSEQQLRTTLASIADGVISCNAEGRVQMMNPVAQELTGWSQTEAHGRPLEEVFQSVSEDTRNPLENPVAKVKRLNSVVGVTNHTVLLRKDGTELVIADSAAPILDQTGNTIGIVLVLRDITMERKTQEALIAHEKLAVAGRLAATIAHEIHNPLDSVSNLLYLMRNGASEEESKQFMAMAEQELARVTQISRAMLGLYRESKAPVAVDLREMLQEILLLMERRLTDLGVTVSTDLPTAISVAAFPAELRQVFTNLISNAAEASAPGNTIEIVARIVSPMHGRAHPRAGVAVIINDHGTGITSADLDRIFQPFFTTKGEHGTGLGLWVSQGIIQKHGGSITVESRTSPTDKGTTITVFLPRGEAELPTT